MSSTIDIKTLNQDDMHDFFVYLDDHISDNADEGSAHFLPISRRESFLSPAMKDNFQKGMLASMNALNWRRAFLAFDEDNTIVGHIDLKSHNQSHTQHRAILGMGVHRDFRKKGIGQMLVEYLIEWTRQNSDIEYIDLMVLSANSKAVRLYQRLGFEELYELTDMYRIDGQSVNCKMMTLAV